VSAKGVAALYGDVLDGIVTDEVVEGVPSLRTDLLMSDAPSRRRLAEETLTFTEGLATAVRQ